MLSSSDGCISETSDEEALRESLDDSSFGGTTAWKPKCRNVSICPGVPRPGGPEADERHGRHEFATRKLLVTRKHEVRGAHETRRLCLARDERRHEVTEEFER